MLITGPDPESLRRLVRAVVEEGLAACANVVPAVTSVYRWQGELMEEGEALAVLKTTADVLPELERRVLELHPYEVPEFVTLPVESGSEAYLEWVEACVEGSGDGGPQD